MTKFFYKIKTKKRKSNKNKKQYRRTKRIYKMRGG